jgi:hypothetical protein
MGLRVQATNKAIIVSVERPNKPSTFVRKAKTLIQSFYSHVLRRLPEAAHRKLAERCNFWPKTARLMFRTLITPQIWHPVTFSLFPKLKLARFGNVITIQRQSQAKLTEFKTQDFCKCFQQWCERWAHCIKPRENYFEGNSMK